MGQPLIPGAILLYTPEKLAFDASGASQLMGNLHDPQEPFLVIDGQHRLAGLEVLGRRQPDTLEKVDVPCVIFDKSQADFAVEMFVIINSTPTRLNRSHLIALYDRLQRSTPVEKAAAKAVALAYGETDSPLHRKVDMLGRRRRTERWIRQASLFRELVRLAEKNEKLLGAEPNAKALYEVTRDFLRAVRKVFAEAWDNPRYHVSTDVTLMAMIRVLGDYVRSARGARTFEAVERQRAFENLIEPWGRMVPEFREEGLLRALRGARPSRAHQRHPARARERNRGRSPRQRRAGLRDFLSVGLFLSRLFSVSLFPRRPSRPTRLLRQTRPVEWSDLAPLALPRLVVAPSPARRGTTRTRARRGRFSGLLASFAAFLTAEHRSSTTLFEVAHDSRRRKPTNLHRDGLPP